MESDIDAQLRCSRKLWCETFKVIAQPKTNKIRKKDNKPNVLCPVLFALVNYTEKKMVFNALIVTVQLLSICMDVLFY